MTKTDTLSNPPTPLVYPVVVVGGGGASSRFWLELPDALRAVGVVHTVEVGVPLSPLQKLTHGYLPVVGRELLTYLEAKSLFPCHLVGATPQGSMAALEAARILANHHIHPDELPGNAVSVSLQLGALTQEDRDASPMGRFRAGVAQFLGKWELVKYVVAFAPYDVRRALASIERPILCIGTQRDQGNHWNSQPRIWELNPHAELKILSSVELTATPLSYDFLTDFLANAETADVKS